MSYYYHFLLLMQLILETGACQYTVLTTSSRPKVMKWCVLLQVNNLKVYFINFTFLLKCNRICTNVYDWARISSADIKKQPFRIHIITFFFCKPHKDPSDIKFDPRHHDVYAYSTHNCEQTNIQTLSVFHSKWLPSSSEFNKRYRIWQKSVTQNFALSCHQ
jgi:hypothetical protein